MKMCDYCKDDAAVVEYDRFDIQLGRRERVSLCPLCEASLHQMILTHLHMERLPQIVSAAFRV